MNYQDNFFFWIESASNLSYNTVILQLAGSFKADKWRRILIEKVLTGVDENGEAKFAKFRQVIIRENVALVNLLCLFKLIEELVRTTNLLRNILSCRV